MAAKRPDSLVRPTPTRGLRTRQMALKRVGPVDPPLNLGGHGLQAGGLRLPCEISRQPQVGLRPLSVASPVPRYVEPPWHEAVTDTAVRANPACSSR
jgi:hypothetical protein